MKLALIPLSILLGVACCTKWGQLPHERKGENQRLGIFGGKNVAITKYPFVVSVSKLGEIWGSGVIVDKNWVLTTAFNALSIEETTLRAGSNKWKAGGQSPTIAGTWVHPNYTGDWQNDVALLKLNAPLKLNKKVAVIKLGTDLPAAGTAGQVVGWGQTSSSVLNSNVLKEADNAILEDATCAKIYDTAYSADSLFCSKIGDNGPCVYDFGDPLVIKNTLYGLYAGGADCSTAPRLYANIPKLAAWINSVISE